MDLIGLMVFDGTKMGWTYEALWEWCFFLKMVLVAIMDGPQLINDEWMAGWYFVF